MEGPGFDLQAFLDYLDNDRTLAVELLTAFIEDAPARLKSLQEAAASGDVEAAVRAAHSLKGMCGVIRNPNSVSQALNLEIAGRRGDLEAVQAGLPGLEAALVLILDQAQAFLAT